MTLLFALFYKLSIVDRLLRGNFTVLDKKIFAALVA